MPTSPLTRQQGLNVKADDVDEEDVKNAEKELLPQSPIGEVNAALQVRVAISLSRHSSPLPALCVDLAAYALHRLVARRCTRQHRTSTLTITCVAHMPSVIQKFYLSSVNVTLTVCTVFSFS